MAAGFNGAEEPARYRGFTGNSVSRAGMGRKAKAWRMNARLSATRRARHYTATRSSTNHCGKNGRIESGYFARMNR
jgi:hypothetical protein